MIKIDLITGFLGSGKTTFLRKYASYLITQGQIWRFLIEETKRRGIGMVIASHSRELLDYVCTRQIDLTDSGRKEEEYGYDANGRAGSVDQI